MQQNFFLGLSPLGFHRIAYTFWEGDTANPPIICVHGLTRNGRDFDRLAQSLSGKRRLFCPDIVGRGKSDWLTDSTHYTYPQYLADMTALIARTGSTQVDWVGTSMGGIMGMMLAAQPQSPIRRLVINDVGPYIAEAGLKRIADYVGLMPEFADEAAAERFLRKNYAPFGITRDEDWRQITTTSVRTLPNGKLTLSYDPAIGVNIRKATGDVLLWNYYDRITCPTLVLRGTLSDIFSAETAEEMTRRGPKAALVEIPDVGHAPALMDEGQIKTIADFLCRS